MSIQPAVFARALGAEHYENGLAYRPLLSMPIDISGRRRYTDPDLSAIQKLNKMLNKLYALEYFADDFSRPVHTDIPFSSQASREWARFCDQIEQNVVPGLKKAVWRKQKTYLARLSLLIEMVTDPDVLAKLQRISHAADRCARIVKTFLAMARERPTESATC